MVYDASDYNRNHSLGKTLLTGTETCRALMVLLTARAASHLSSPASRPMASKTARRLFVVIHVWSDDCANPDCRLEDGGAARIGADHFERTRASSATLARTRASSATLTVTLC
jgi:hypothetical protein